MRRSIPLCAALLLAACSSSPASTAVGATPDADASAPSEAGPSLDSEAPIDPGLDATAGTGGDANDAASDAGDPPTFAVKRGALLFSDDFSAATYTANWTVVGATWTLADGHLSGVRAAGEKDPNIGHLMPVDHVVIQFAFMGAGSPGIRLNHAAPDPQHLVNVGITTSKVDVSQMSGWGDTTVSTSLDSAVVALDPAVWHIGVVEVYDTAITVSVDGKKLVSGATVDQSATPRDQFLLETDLTTTPVSYDDVKVWEALPL